MGASILLTLAYRFIPPPATPLMGLRLLEQYRTDQNFRLRYSWKPLEQISPQLAAAVVAAEDQRFFEHHGFDFLAITSAFRHNQQGRHVMGASTISQQTAKNVFLWPDRSWARKGLEVWFTALIEILWPKRRILEVYLNVIETGPGIYGAEAAANQWFYRPARSLNREQAALLAACLPNPRKWTPATPPRNVLRRQAWILRQIPQLARLPLSSRE